MRIENNLLTADEHLVQLLKLDAVGADALSEDKEKQLRWVWLLLTSQLGPFIRKYSCTSTAYKAGGTLVVPVHECGLKCVSF